jgi:hypothetical protein
VPLFTDFTLPMEPNHPGSRKRANPPVVPPNERLCHSPSYEDHSQHRPRGKHPRLGYSITGPASPSNAFTVSVNSSSHDVLGRNFSNTYTETNANIDVFEDEFSLLTPPGNPPGFTPYPSVNDQPSRQQDVEATNNAAGTSVTYTISNGTFSPRSMVQQVLGNTNDGTAQSPGGASEPFFGGSDDIALDINDINDMLQWSILNNNPPTFDGLGKSSF